MLNLKAPTAPTSTARIHLRLFQPSDFSTYAAYHSREEVYRYLYSAPPSGSALEAQFQSLLRAPFAHDGDQLTLAVARQEDGVLLGEVLFKLANAAALQGEIGYIFNPDFGGKGYATEAVGALMEHGFHHIGFHRIFARLDAANSGSIGIVERLAMRKEAHLLQNDRFNGQWGDEYIYALLASEWASRVNEPPHVP